MKIFKNLIFPFLFLVLIQDVFSQCAITDSLVIPDLFSKNITYIVSSAANNDLANPNQGICGVNIEFKHEVVGDLTIELISPSGQSIFLTGPTGFSTLTQGSTWDINFVPCSQPAAPDIGFLPVWTNGANWSADVDYTGTYYPALNNCLEDINTGPVNGKWIIHVSDNSQFDVGVILNFSIEFCDQTGIDCFSCEPDGGLVSGAPLIGCQGTDSLIIPFNPTFINGAPNSSVYNYGFMVLQGALITDIRPTTNLTDLEEGVYFICGLSYPASDQSQLPTSLDSLTLVEFRQNLASTNPLLCGSISNNCVRVDILNTPDTLKLNEIICSGDSVVIGNQVFNSTGEFMIPLQTIAGCDSIVELDLTVFDPLASALIPPILSCGDTITLDGSASVVSPNGSVRWVTNDGNIISRPDDFTAVINKRGIYRLIVTEDGCADTLNVDVMTDLTIPNLNLRISDTVNCVNPVARMLAGVNPLNATVTWTHPDTIMMGNEVFTDKPGRYFVLAELGPGCVDSAVLNLVFDDELEIEGGDITCAVDSVDLSAASNLAGNLTYTWTLPDNSNFDGRFLKTGLGGDFIMTVSSDNGCESIDTFTVNLDNQPPELRRVRGAQNLTCNRLETNLTYITDARSPTYMWTGPNGFMSMDSSPVVMEPGTYTLTITDSISQCVATVSGEVNQNLSSPEVTLMTDTITCNQSKVTIEVESDQRIVESNWTGPNSFVSSLAVPTVENPGLYYLESTNNNGCTSLDSIEVFFVDDRPDLIALGASLPCNGDSVRLNASSNSEGVTIQWFGPDNFFSLDLSPNVLDTGSYIVTAIGTNGCFRSDTVVVDTNPPFPVATISASLLTCAQEIVQINTTSDTTGSLFSWTGPNGFMSNDQSPFVQDSGTYFLSLEAPNGCVTDTSIFVNQSREDPLVIARALDSVICDQVQVRLDASLSDSGPDIAYEWSSADGQIVNGQNNVLATAQGVGIYTLTVTDFYTGCEASADVEVFEKISDLESVMFTTFDPNCLGGFDGSVVINSVRGGRGPYTFSFNSSNFNEETTNLNLSAGQYSIAVKDTFGCVIDTLFDLMDPPPFTIDLGNDTTIILGDSILLSPQISIPTSSIANLMWSPAPACDTCFQNYFMPVNTIRIFLTATSILDCESTDEIVIRVDEGNEIFIPNVFSPNNDNINDRFTVFGTQRVVGIKSLRIFDRWGEIVFENENFAPGDLSAGWDGTLNGKPLNPGVFVYISEIELFGQTIKILKGDVTLLR